MNTKALADEIINEIKKIDIVNSSGFLNLEIEESISGFLRAYENAHDKAYIIDVPHNVRFRLLKRVIGKLIRPFTRKQVDYNWHMLELVKLQHTIIMKHQDLIIDAIIENRASKKTNFGDM